MRVGDVAPPFTLSNQHGEAVALSDFAGVKNVVLVFYPFAFSRVCTGELETLRDGLDDIARADAELLAISCDHMFSLRAFADRDGYTFSLLSDFWPHGAVSTAYEALDETNGAARRTTVIVDRGGTVRWRVDNTMSEARSVDEYREILYGLR